MTTSVSPPLGIFAMRDKVEHSQRTRLLSHAFSQASLLGTEPLIKQHIDKLVTHVMEGLKMPLDALLLFRLTSFDIIGTLTILYHCQTWSRIGAGVFHL